MNESYSVQVLIKFWDSIPQTFIFTILLGLYSQKISIFVTVTLTALIWKESLDKIILTG